MTQEELAITVRMSVGALRDLEQGRTRAPRWETLEGLVAVLGLGEAQRAELILALRTRSAPIQPPMVRIDVLGALAVSRDKVALPLGSARQRTVLGLLAVHAGADVHRDTIIDVLWGERPPASAVNKVQGYVSQLRRMLGIRLGGGAEADLVATAGCGYRLDVDVSQLDLAAFVHLDRQAGEAARGREPALACDRYERALRLWRGDILADLDLLRDYPAAVEITCRRASAVLGYAEAARMTGKHAAVLPHLRELCAREPLNEQAYARLIATLAAIGQRAAAIEVFAAVRRRLDAELGISPGALLADAYHQILHSQAHG